MSNLVLPSIDGFPAIEYRALDGQLEAHRITVQRRTLRPDGDKYRAGDWRTLCAGDVRRQVRLEGPVAQWLRTETCVDLREDRLAAYEDEEPAHFFLVFQRSRGGNNNVAEDSRGAS